MDETATGNQNVLLQINPRNLLSFGPDAPPIPLRNLNVLIGPNGSGKSNLIEVVSLLRATSGDLRSAILRGGGIDEWVWKGQPDGRASVEAVVANPGRRQALRHSLSLEKAQRTFHLADESIGNEHPYPGHEDAYFYYRYNSGDPIINLRGGKERKLVRETAENDQLVRETLENDQSILSQRRDPEAYPEVTYLASVYAKMRIYREWTFGRKAVFREPQKVDMRNDRLEEDFSNLGLFLNRLRRSPKTKRAIVDALRDLYEGLSDFDVSIEGGTVQVFFTEGDFTIPATRLSDGTVRYLCLLAILCDDSPPPLICIEEPELGLHPDILPKIADLLIAASERTEIIVTTHSDVLVDAMTEHPESVLVCEKHDGQTSLKRLVRHELAQWLEKYRLGILWMRGELGGTRW